MNISNAAMTLMLSAGAFAISIAGASAHKLHDKTHTVKCDQGKSLQEAIDKARHGETLEVQGVCIENILVRVDQINIVGSGSGAGISPADPNVNTVDVQATNVVIRNLNIAVQNFDRYAIIVHRGGSATIQRNTINGPGSSVGTQGILVTDNSYARIGGSSSTPGDTGSTNDRGNTISNHGRGITVRLGSGADIFFNVISDNGRGINLNNIGAIDAADNLISGNGRGLSIATNASAALSGSTSSTGGANTFTANAVAIRCRLGGALTNVGQTSTVLQIDGGGNGSLDNYVDCHVSSASMFF